MDVSGSTPASLCCNVAGTVGDVVTPPSHGTVDNHHDGTFTYQRDDDQVGSGTDDGFASLLTELEGIPLEVWTAVSLKVAPRLLHACETVSGGTVSPATIAAALVAVEELDADHPGKAEALQLLQEAEEIIEGRNEAIEFQLDVHSTALGLIIAGLEAAGEEELAAEIAAAAEACGD